MSKQHDPAKPAPIVLQRDMDDLVGYLLTQIDASVTGSNKESLKSLIRQYCWQWFGDLQPYTEFLGDDKDFTLLPHTANINEKGEVEIDQLPHEKE